MKKSGSCREVRLVMAHCLMVFIVGGAVMSRRLFLTHGKRQSCAYCQYSNLPAHLHRLISLSFLTFRVSSKSRH